LERCVPSLTTAAPRAGCVGSGICWQCGRAGTERIRLREKGEMPADGTPMQVRSMVEVGRRWDECRAKPGVRRDSCWRFEPLALSLSPSWSHRCVGGIKDSLHTCGFSQRLPSGRMCIVSLNDARNRRSSSPADGQNHPEEDANHVNYAPMSHASQSPPSHSR
jgi:hypothetical protein